MIVGLFLAGCFWLVLGLLTGVDLFLIVSMLCSILSMLLLALSLFADRKNR